MPEFIRDLHVRPSRLLGWGFVAVVHLLMWQVLSHGFDLAKVIPVLNSVQISLLKTEPPPELSPPPTMPETVQPVTAELFVPAPEVKVTQEAVTVVAATSVPPQPRMSDAAPSAIPSQSRSNALVVVSESEVDYLVKPEVRYPLASKRAKEHGLVLLSVIVNAQGFVEYVYVYKSSGYHRLDEYASRAVRRMRVKPYIRNGIAMSIELRIPVEFSWNSTGMDG